MTSLNFGLSLDQIKLSLLQLFQEILQVKF